MAKAPEPDLAQLAREGRMSLGELLSYSDQLQSQGHLQAACNLYGLWLSASADPRRHLAYFNYGALLQSTGQTEQAQLAYQAALALEPGFAQASINLGLSFERLGQNEKALQAWAQVVGQRLLAGHSALEWQTTALNHIGRLQEQLKNYAQAEQALEESLRLQPRQTGVIQHWVHIRQKACKWPVYKELPGISLGQMLRATSPLAMLALSDDPVQQLLTAQSFVSRTYTMKEERLCEGRRYQHTKLRIGYVSADLREHAVGFLLPSFFEGHDRERYELYAYDYTKHEDTPTRRQLQAVFHQVRPIHGLSDREAAQRILDDEIDILIDLHGLSSGARPGIFALHPAPLQGTYLGFIGSTGMPWFDFVLADRQVLPPELAVHFTEKPLYLEGSFLPLAATPESLPAVGRAELGLAEDAFVMGAFGNVYKITPQMFATWMMLLKRIPRSVVWLIDDNVETTANLRAEAAKAGVDPARLVFASRTDHVHFCARLRLADVFLDTYPYNCGSTARDIVNAGVPLVSLYGDTMVSRMGLSILHSVGCAHLAVQSLADYEDKVVEVWLKTGEGRLPPYSRPTHPARIHLALAQWEEPGRTTASLAALPLKKRKKSATGLSAEPETGPTLSQTPGLQLYQWGAAGRGEALYAALPAARADSCGHSGHAQVREFLLDHTLEDDSFYGFFPPDFGPRTGLGPQAVVDLVRRHGACDVLGLGPAWHPASLCLNPFVHAQQQWDGLLPAAQKFASTLGLHVDLSQHPMHSGNTVLGYFFVAKRRFWLAWLEAMEHWRAQAGDPSSPVQAALAELMATLLHLKGGWSSHCLDPFGLGREDLADPLFAPALMADALKLRHAHTGLASCLTQLQALQRSSVQP